MGTSLKPSRYSNIAINRLAPVGNKAVAFGLRKGEIAGIKVGAKLLKYKNIDTVTLYLNSKN